MAGVREAAQTGTYKGELTPLRRRIALSDGTKDDVKGRTKEAAGSLTGDKSLKNEGKVDRASGKVKDKVGDASDKVKDVVNPSRT